MTSSVPRAAGLATVATFAGYGTTLLQQAVYARALGVGSDTDALAAALTWVIAVTGLLGSVFAGVVIPSFTRLLATDPEGARAQFQVANGRALAIGLVAAGATFVFAPALAAVLMPGAVEAERGLLVRLLQLSAPLQVLWIAVLTAVSLANARGRFVVAALSTVVPSIPVIALLAAPDPSVERAIFGYSLGAALQLGVLLTVLRPNWPDYSPRLSLATRTGLESAAISVAVAFLLFSSIGILARALSSLVATGDVAIFDYASRLTSAAEQVLLSGALAVVLTTWSTDSASTSASRLPVPIAFRSAIVLVAMSAGALIALGTDFADFLLEGGQFSQEDAIRLGQVLAWIAPGMAAHMLLMLAVRAHLARGRLRALNTSALLGLLVFAGAAVALRSLQLTGIAISYSVAWTAAAIASIALLDLGTDANRVLLREGVRSSIAAIGTVVLTMSVVSVTALTVSSSFVRLAIGITTYVVVGGVIAVAFDLYLVRASILRLLQHRGLRFLTTR